MLRILRNDASDLKYSSNFTVLVVVAFTKEEKKKETKTAIKAIIPHSS